MCFVLTSILCVSTIFSESLVSLACVSHASFAKKAKERVNFNRAFPKRVGPRILSLESDDHFGTK